MDSPVPSGPRKVGSRHQVSLPGEMLEAIGVSIGDSVFVALNPDRPGTLVVMTRDGMADIFRKGWTALS